MENALVIMAAGLGSRYGGLKQMEGFGPAGERILEFSVFDAIRAGFGSAVFIIRKDMESDFREQVLVRFQNRIPCKLVFQPTELSPAEADIAGGAPAGRTKPWGTGHALLCALQQIDSPFLLMNADDFYGPESFRQAAEFFESTPEETDQHAIIAYNLSRTLSRFGTVSRGVIETDAEGNLLGITERHKIERKTEGIIYEDPESGRTYILGRNTPVSMNLMALKPSVRPVAEKAWKTFLENSAHMAQAEFGVPDVLETLRTRPGSTIKVLNTPESWMGVTHPDDAPSVREGLKQQTDSGTYPSPLWQGGSVAKA